MIYRYACDGRYTPGGVYTAMNREIAAHGR